MLLAAHLSAWLHLSDVAPRRQGVRGGSGQWHLPLLWETLAEFPATWKQMLSLSSCVSIKEIIF